MEQYARLAEYYDRLTEDVPYDRMASRLDALLARGRPQGRLVLELGCGTGSMTCRLARLGWEMIAVDASCEMLRLAGEKCRDLPVPPVFVCQDMTRLDLYGTVQAAVCTLDGLNYLPDLAALRRALGRVALFLERGGLFAFDVKSPALFEAMAGGVSVCEDEDFFCAWQYGYDRAGRRGQHIIDLFEKRGGSYRRFTEYHSQRAFTRPQIEAALDGAGLRVRGVFRDYSGRRAQEDAGRLLFVAEKV